MRYPGRLIKVGESDAPIVRALKTRLNSELHLEGRNRLTLGEPTFGPKMKAAVQLFQSRNVDAAGAPLKADGRVGAITWAALFGDDTVATVSTSESELLSEALAFAGAEAAKPVREVPRNSNRGPDVDRYLTTAGCPTGLAWCCAFVYWSMDQAANSLGRANPMVKTGRCLDHWQRAKTRGARLIKKADAINDPSLVKPGMIFLMDYGEGKGHTGFVEKTAGGFFTTIEGNTDASKTREGGGVYRLERKVADINKGFIDYGGA
jgi:hypothetical protein